jgi:murein DD-endopeptidase MepM/ murein hydrolase activator NlpD
MKPGARVAQGDVIGYVGATGLATGPHLDYRVQHRGKWIDPTSLREQPAPPIGATEMASFLEARDQLREGLASGAFAGGDEAAGESTRLAGLPAAIAGGS